jgi:hypothetical protein
MNKQLAQLIVNLIPATCPFNKSFKFAGFSVTIPSVYVNSTHSIIS